jgi:ABC-type glycerol-3-phosphate transport system permease component
MNSYTIAVLAWLLTVALSAFTGYYGRRYSFEPKRHDGLATILCGTSLVLLIFYPVAYVPFFTSLTPAVGTAAILSMIIAGVGLPVYATFVLGTRARKRDRCRW